MTKATDTQSDEIRADTLRDDDEKSPERLEREVDEARSRLGRTASELSDRLSPGELIDQALGMAREHGGEFGRNLGTQVKNNPMPLILTGIGVSWLLMASGTNNNGVALAQPSYDMSETDKEGSGIADKLGGVKETLGDAAAKTRAKASEVGDRMHDASANMGDRMHDTGANMRESAQDVRESLVHFYRDQPLIAGSVGIAIGAALGALVPPTAVEDDVLGESSDRSVDAAKARAASKYEEVRESVRS